MILLSLCAGFSGFMGRLFFSNKPYVQIGDNPANRYVGDAAINALQYAVNGRKTLLMICGYNNDEAGAVASYKTIERNLRARGVIDDQWRVMGLLWPDHTTAGFWAAEKSANDSGNRLRDVLKQLQPLELHVETHSLGARVWLSSVNLDPCPSPVTTCLTSPAVDCESLGSGQEFNAAAKRSGKLLVCFSQHDPVLQKAFRWFGSLDGKHLLGDNALGFSGPVPAADRPANVQLEDGTAYVATHGAWRDAPQFYDRWKRLVEGEK
jgi:hypothetical protein